MTGIPPIIIAGCGPGHPDYLTDAVRNAVAGAEVLVGARHLLDLFPGKPATRIPVGSDIPAVVARIEAERQRRIVVLVSGDPGLFSLARTLQKHFGTRQCQLLPGVSSVQLACARLGIDWHDLQIVSAHGRSPEITADSLNSCRKIAVLAGTGEANRWAADLLDQLGERYRAFACENLTLEDERIRQLGAAGLRTAELASRTIILLLAPEVAA